MKHLQTKDGVLAVPFGHMMLSVFALFVATVAGVVLNRINPERKDNRYA